MCISYEFCYDGKIDKKNEMEKFFYVYKTTNLLDGKEYIGKHESREKSDEYLGSGLLLNRAIRKYGKEHFHKEILEYCNSQEQLCEREEFWIKNLNTFFPNGYNIATGGYGGDIYTNNPDRVNICARQSYQLKYFPSNAQKSTQEKLKVSRLGAKHSEEAKRKISKAREGMIFTEKHKKNISEKTKEAMKTAKIKRKKIDVFDVSNNFIEQLPSLQAVAIKYEQNVWEVCNMCKGRKNRVKNYIFKYAEL